MKEKSEAVWVTFHELGGMINLSEFSRRYFGKSQSWFAQKLYMNRVNGKLKEFTPAELDHIAKSLRELGETLTNYANEIDAAQCTEEDRTRTIGR